MASHALAPLFLLPKLSWKTGLPCSNARLPLPNKAVSQLHKSRNIASERHVVPWLPLSGKKRSRPNDSFRPARRFSYARAFSTSRTNQRDHHFDTLKFVQRLRSEGFSEEQSKAMMLVLSDVIEESIQNLTRTMVLKEGGSIHP